MVFDAGDIVGGKYCVTHSIARGGMGYIVAATHAKLGTKVALKFLRPDYLDKPAVVERFVHEARAAAQLRSENVCRVWDVETTADGVPYMVMELLEGRDLQSIIKMAPLDAATAAHYVLQACNAIAEAHGLGIVHRDIKPANLYRTYRADGTTLIKVLDFGVAKVQPKDEDHGLTQTQTVMGSPGYMSPEQLRSSKNVDPRTDIWSLGVVLYELVVGTRPWVAESVTELALKVAHDPMTPMPAIVDAGYVAVVERCLRKERDERFADIAELATALAPFAERGGDLAGGVSRVLGATSTGPLARIAPEPPAPAAPPTIASEAVPTTLRTASGIVSPVTSLRRRPPLLALGAGAALVVAIVVVLSLRGGDGVQSAADTVDLPEPPAQPVEPPPAVVAPAIDAAVEAPVVEAGSATMPPPADPPEPPSAATRPTRPAKATKPLPTKPAHKKRPTIKDVRDSRI